MKIGADIRVLMDKYYSGISEYTANLLSALLKQGENNGGKDDNDVQDEYKLFYNSYHDIGGRLDKWKKTNSRIIGLRFSNKIFNYCLQKIFKYPRIDRVLGGVDIFWSPHFNFTSLSGPESGLKKVVTVHDLSFLRYPEFFNWRKNFWHKALGVKKILREADMIVAVSGNTKNDIAELVGIDPKKIKVIYSGNNVIKKERPEDEIKTCLDKFGLRESGADKPFILCVGNIEPRKNISGLIKAYEQLRQVGEKSEREGGFDNFKDVRLVLAGAPGWKNARIYSDWQKSVYKDGVKFLGYIDKEEKEILYSRASIFAYPSFYEGFGFPPLEAMAYGVPVVCSNVSSLPEIVADSGLMINPDRPEEIAEAIKIILTDKELRARLVASGYERVKSFSWDKAAKEYLESFKELYESKK